MKISHIKALFLYGRHISKCDVCKACFDGECKSLCTEGGRYLSYCVSSQVDKDRYVLVEAEVSQEEVEFLKSSWLTAS